MPGARAVNFYFAGPEGDKAKLGRHFTDSFDCRAISQNRKYMELFLRG
jgi:hypothetical protein